MATKDTKTDPELRKWLMVQSVIDHNWDGIIGDMTAGEIADEWLRAGFLAHEVWPWWVARCFNPSRTAECRAANLDPRALIQVCALGDTIGYHHSNGDITLAEAKALISRLPGDYWTEK
jgi:hypothetical protein